jgi:uncharacterized membrane protein
VTKAPEPPEAAGSPPTARETGQRRLPHRADERTLFGLGRTGQQRAADAITRFAGSMPFVYVHILWFGVWILLNEGALGPGAVFDPFPYGLLTMTVSLEAIFLSTFVMISQNRESERQNLRADLDFETNVRSEVWSLHIGRRLGLDPAVVESEVQALLRQARADLQAGGEGRAAAAPASGPPGDRRA